MTSDSFVIKQGDTQPVLERNLLGADGSAIDLTTAGSVTFRMTKVGAASPAVERTCVITDAANGSVRFLWQNGDTALAGAYRAEFEILFGVEPLTVPNNGYMNVSVLKELG